MTNVLVLGEHGTGKEVVARWLHAASPRVGSPLVSRVIFSSPLISFQAGAAGARQARGDSSPRRWRWAGASS